MVLVLDGTITHDCLVLAHKAYLAIGCDMDVLVLAIERYISNHMHSLLLPDDPVVHLQDLNIYDPTN